MNQIEELVTYITNTYDAIQELPDRHSPGSIVFKQKNTKQPFAILKELKRTQLHLNNNLDAYCSTLSVQCDTELRDFLIDHQKYFPCPFMDHHWMTILLDECDEDELHTLIKDSCMITSRHAHKRTVLHNTNWIVPANPKYYDIEKAVREGNGTFIWKQSNSILKDDNVYLYIASPVSAVKYACKVLESDIPYVYEDKNVRMKKVMKLQLLHTYKDTDFPFSVLKQFHVSSIRGPRSIPDSLLAELIKKAGENG